MMDTTKGAFAPNITQGKGTNNPRNNQAKPRILGAVMRELEDNPDSLMHYIAKHREEVRNGQ